MSFCHSQPRRIFTFLYNLPPFSTIFTKQSKLLYMLPRLISSSRTLGSRASYCLLPKTQFKTHFLSTFPTTIRDNPLAQNSNFVRMSSGNQNFPPQKQETQPGKEHVMDPVPQYTNPDYKPSNKLQGKVALITGGDSGIGRAVCHCFALEGATLAFTYVKAQEDKDARDTLEMIRKVKTQDSEDPMAIAVDLGYDENCKRVVDEVVNAYGRIDILINNAAEQYESTTPEEIDELRLERVFRTNIFSYFFMTRHALKHMKEGSSIINTTSINAYKGNATLLDYTATKGAIVAFTRGLALQLVSRGIRVNGVAPGPIWTPLIPASFSEDKVASFGSEVPMKRAGQPIEVAPSYVFLACDACSSYISGQVLHPNGNRMRPIINCICGCLAMNSFYIHPHNTASPYYSHIMRPA